MTRVLLDPGLVVPAEDIDPMALPDFWTQLVEWQADSRFVLGPRTYDALTSFYVNAVCVGPDQWVPRGMSTSIHGAIGRLLGRSPVAHSTMNRPAELTPVYVGSTALASILVDDLCTCEDAQMILGSNESHWATVPDYVEAFPPPPGRVTVILTPCLPTQEDVRASMHTRFRDTSLVIVGGQADQRLLTALNTELGIPSERIEWIPSEKNKPPRNLAAVIRGAALRAALVVCVTGKIGHASSNKLRDECASSGIVPLLVETATLIPAEVRMLSQTWTTPRSSKVLKL